MLIAVPFLTYCMDPISVGLRGGAAPEETLYLTTALADGGAAIDRLLDETARAKGWRFSRADWSRWGNESPQPRELWKPGASVMVMREFACRKADDRVVQFRTNAFILTATRLSFLTSRASLKELLEELRARIAASRDIRILAQRLECESGLID